MRGAKVRSEGAKVRSEGAKVRKHCRTIAVHHRTFAPVVPSHRFCDLLPPVDYEVLIRKQLDVRVRD